MALTLRRFLVVQMFMLWQGGFLFYASFVVPEGTKLLGAAGQGAITARVTDALNAAGVVGLAVLALDLSVTRDPHRRRATYRWAGWAVALACQGLLIYTHTILEGFMDEDRRGVVIRTRFKPVHRVYLWTSTVQWAAGLLLVWWTLRAWRAEDRAGDRGAAPSLVSTSIP